MTPPMTPREKVAQIIKEKVSGPRFTDTSHFVAMEQDRFAAADAILTALASGPGDHAELARLAEAATPGPWVCKEGSTSYPECDDKDFWSVVLSPAGKEIVTLHERYASKSDDRGDYDFDAAFIAAANPVAVLALLAENAALRERLETARIARAAHNRQHGEAERKLAEARLNYEGALSDIDSLLTVLIRRINGEKDLASAAEWVRLNYPLAAEKIIGMEVEPKSPSAT